MNQKAGREEFAPPMKTNYDPKRTLTCCEKKCQSERSLACSEGCKMWLHHSSLNWESKKWWVPLQKKCQKDCTMPRLWAASQLTAGNTKPRKAAGHWTSVSVHNEYRCKAGCSHYYKCM